MSTHIANEPDLIPKARQAVYRFIQAALCLPTPDQHAWMRTPNFHHSLEELAEAFGVNYPDGDLVPEAWADHESRYLACFEVGLPTPPVPLLASHYQKREPVPRIIHEHLLFFRRLSMPMVDCGNVPADHLVHQLNFLIHLDDLLSSDRIAIDSILWARGDFLSRHVRGWAADACRQAMEKGLPPVYGVLLAIFHAAVEEDVEWTSVNKPSKIGDKE